MGNVIRIGPYESSPLFGKSAGYEDKRDTLEIEKLLNTNDEFFFRNLLLKLRKRFPSNVTLSILDSGCGYGYTLRSLTDIANRRKIYIQTTGITMSKDHELASGWVDTLVIGSLQKAFAKNLLKKNSYHFVIDMCGPAFFYSIDDNEGRSEIISCYSKLVKKGGFLLLYLLQLNPHSQLVKARGKLFAESVFSTTTSMLEENGFKINFHKGEFILLEKM